MLPWLLPGLSMPLDDIIGGYCVCVYVASEHRAVTRFDKWKASVESSDSSPFGPSLKSRKGNGFRNVKQEVKAPQSCRKKAPPSGPRKTKGPKTFWNSLRLSISRKKEETFLLIQNTFLGKKGGSGELLHTRESLLNRFLIFLDFWDFGFRPCETFQCTIFAEIKHKVALTKTYYIGYKKCC